MTGKYKKSRTKTPRERPFKKILTKDRAGFDSTAVFEYIKVSRSVALSCSDLELEENLNRLFSGQQAPLRRSDIWTVPSHWSRQQERGELITEDSHL